MISMAVLAVNLGAAFVRTGAAFFFAGRATAFFAVFFAAFFFAFAIECLLERYSSRQWGRYKLAADGADAA